MTRGRKGEDIHWRFARPSFHPLPCPEPTLATCAPRPSGARSAGRHHVRRDQPVVANLAAPANAKFYPVTVYGVRNLQCATRCNSPGPWACHHRQYLHQTSHTFTRPQAGHTSRSRSKATSDCRCSSIAAARAMLWYKGDRSPGRPCGCFPDRAAVRLPRRLDDAKPDPDSGCEALRHGHQAQRRGRD